MTSLLDLSMIVLALFFESKDCLGLVIKLRFYLDKYP
jgi:hypothetical protein